MGKMRKLVIKEIKKFIENEDGLKGDEWKDNYFQCSDDKPNPIHISNVDYMELDDDNALRFLMYLLLERDRASEYRIKNNNYE